MKINGTAPKTAPSKSSDLVEAQKRNPFVTGRNPFTGEPTVQAMDATSRKEALKRFDLAQCRAALKVPGLQLTVQQALERRIRQLQKEAPKS